MIDLQAPHTLLRPGAFFAILLVMLVWERRSPRRRGSLPVRARWISNIGLGALNALLLRLALPALAVGVARYAELQNWGLFNHFDAGTLPALAASVLLLDLVVYFQHRLFHSVDVLWRLHRVHHTDVDYDATTAIRFHPGEAVLSMLLKGGAVIALGAPVAAVLLFEVLLNATALFNHGNVRIPPSLDQRLRWLVVTPDMHRVHHSVEPEELNCNFGFNFPLWDRWFGTYLAQPRDGHEFMTIGIRQFRDASEQRIDRLLMQPLR